jgi:hypothetical protein
MRILISEAKICLKRKEIHFVFLLLLLISITAFIMECLAFYGSNLKFVRSSAESSLVQGVYAGSARLTLIFILPLLSSLIYSDSFYTEYHNGVLKTILTKVDKSKYIFYKSIVTFFFSFFVFFITLFINLILCTVTFPQVGFDNIYSLPPYDIAIQNYDNTYFLDIIRIESPFLFNVISIILLSLFAGLFSLFTLGIYFLFLSKNRVFGLFFSFLCYIGANILLVTLGFNDLALTNQLKPIHSGTILQLIFWIIAIFVVSIYFIKKGINKEIIN